MNRKDIALYIGSTWFIDQVAMDRFGVPLNMTGGVVEFRLAKKTGLLLNLSSTAGEINIASGVGGGYTLLLRANDARQDALLAGVYDYEIDAITAAGIVSVQTNGKLTLVESLRRKFPGGTSPPSHVTLMSGGQLLLADGVSGLLRAA